MITLDKDQAKRRATDLHCNGYHCAEAVLVSVLEAAEAAIQPPIPRVATCFGGGVGRSRGEICGALVGGLIAVGCVCGRDRQGQNWDGPAEVAFMLREQFLARQGSTCCSEILAALGPQQNNHLCRQLSGTTAELTCQILESYIEQGIVSLGSPTG